MNIIFLCFGDFVFSGDFNFILLLETRPLDGIYLIVLTFVCVPVMFHVVYCPFLCSVLICILWIRLLGMHLICNFHLLILSIHLLSIHVKMESSNYMMCGIVLSIHQLAFM